MVCGSFGRYMSYQSVNYINTVSCNPRDCCLQWYILGMQQLDAIVGQQLFALNSMGADPLAIHLLNSSWIQCCSAIQHGIDCADNVVSMAYKQ